MEADLDAIDWNELTKFGDTEGFAEWRMEQEEEPNWILSGEKVGWMNDSGSTFFGIAEALNEMAGELPEAQRELLENSYLILFAAGDEFTIEDIPCIPDSCYIFALSPERVASIHESISQLDRQVIVRKVTESMEGFEADWISDFFNQTDAVVKAALSRNWGILGFAG